MGRNLPSPFNTYFFRGMYDPEELIGWIEHEEYSPVECVSLFPLCITSDNCEKVFQLIDEVLGSKYLRFLQQHVTLLTDEMLDQEKHYSQHQHYLLDDRVDPRYITGVHSIQHYLAKFGSLEKNL